MPKRSLAAIALVSAAALTPAADAAAAPYIVMVDPAEIAESDDTPNIGSWRNKLLEQYATLGLELPEVLSIWTAFPMAGNNYSTYIDPRENDVTGIGFDSLYPNEGLFETDDPPLKALLWHNNILKMDARAGLHKAPVEGYARYLFLLELSHLWGPAAQAPAPGEGDLIGFPYHWSFFRDEPGPAGGNAWTDNGDGTFTVVPGDPATVRFNMLDLYLMGLADASEVTPFGVLVQTAVPPTPTDPFWGGAYAPRSFPWFDTAGEPLTVTATRRELTIDDIVAANGPRVPAAGTKDSWTMGIVLVVKSDATAEDIAAAKTAFDPIAESLAPAFSDATMGRGTLEIVTNVEEGGGGAGGGGTGGAGGSDGGTTTSSGSGGSDGGDDDGAEDGCGCRSSAGEGGAGALGIAVALGLALRRRRRG
jgi:MYXO-CTERM domain-containing protein